MSKNNNLEGTLRRLPKRKDGKEPWQCSIETKDEHGNRKMISASALTQSEAKAKARKKFNKYKRQLASSKNETEFSDKDSFNEAVKKWLKLYATGRWQDQTYASRLSDFDKVFIYFDGYNVEDVKGSDIDGFITDCSTSTNRQSMGMVISLMQKFFKKAYSRGIISENPFNTSTEELAPTTNSHEKGKKVVVSGPVSSEDLKDFDEDVKLFTDEEVNKIIGACYVLGVDFEDKFGRNKRNKGYEYPRAPIYALMLLTGMRGQEIRALSVGDIDFKNKTIRINKAVSEYKLDGKRYRVIKTTKNKSSNRTIGINEQTAKIAQMVLELRPQKGDLLYCTKSGLPVERNNFARDFGLLLDKLKIPRNKRGPHCLRHTFASLALEGNVLSPLRDKSALHISNYLGHSSLDTTYRIYAHLDSKKLREVTPDEEHPILEIDIDFEPEIKFDESEPEYEVLDVDFDE